MPWLVKILDKEFQRTKSCVRIRLSYITAIMITDIRLENVPDMKMSKFFLNRMLLLC